MHDKLLTYVHVHNCILLQTDDAHKDNEVLGDAPTVKIPSDDHHASDDNENQKMNNASVRL